MSSPVIWAMLPSCHGMPGSHWLITLSPENFSIMRDMRFGLLGLRSRHRKKAERVAVGDRVLYYVLTERIFPATATVTSAYFEDRHPMWVNNLSLIHISEPTRLLSISYAV